MTLARLLGISAGPKFGSIDIDVTTNEVFTHDSEVTAFPVEGGFSTDNVRFTPFKLNMEGIVAAQKTNIIEAAISLFARVTPLNEYDKLLELRATREPFIVVTGLKIFENMVFRSFTVERNESQSSAVFFRAELWQVEIVDSKIDFTSPSATTALRKGASAGNLGSTVPASASSAASASTGTVASRAFLGKSGAKSTATVLGGL